MWKKAGIVLAVLFGVVFLVLVANAFRIDRDREILSLCWKDIVDPYCGEASFSDDGKCVRKAMSDGAECRGWKENFCELSCVCKDGESQVERRDCDDDNPCTLDECGHEVVDGRVLRDKPLACVSSFGVFDGFRCGQDQGGVCSDDFCVRLYDTIYADFP